MVNIHIHEFRSAGAPLDDAALTQFRKHWASYQKLVDNNYLSHREVGRLLHDTLTETFDAPFAFLDIACGDASLPKAACTGTPIRHYHGIDLAQPAIELAAANLTDVPYEVDLDHRDFVEALNDRPEPADMSWIGLSLHHLETAEKIRLMEAIRRATKRMLMIYEPARRNDEDRAAFLTRFLATAKARWAALTERGMERHRNSTSARMTFPRRSTAGSTSAGRRASRKPSWCSPTRPTGSGSSATSRDRRRLRRHRPLAAERLTDHLSVAVDGHLPERGVLARDARQRPCRIDGDAVQVDDHIPAPETRHGRA